MPAEHDGRRAPGAAAAARTPSSGRPIRGPRRRQDTMYSAHREARPAICGTSGESAFPVRYVRGETQMDRQETADVRHRSSAASAGVLEDDPAGAPNGTVASTPEADSVVRPDVSGALPEGEAEIELRGVSKLFTSRHRETLALTRHQPRHPQGGVRRARRPVGLRQDDDAADPRRPHQADQRRGPHRGPPAVAGQHAATTTRCASSVSSSRTRTSSPGTRSRRTSPCRCGSAGRQEAAPPARAASSASSSG